MAFLFLTIICWTSQRRAFLMIANSGFSEQKHAVPRIGVMRRSVVSSDNVPFWGKFG